MKLLLTSGGLSNNLIVEALQDLVRRDFSDVSVAFIPTAANVEAGDKSWLIKDLTKLKELNFKSIDIVDISALSEDTWLPRLEVADILYFEGGNTFHLMRKINESGLNEKIMDFMKEKVWVGVSAGSMVPCPDLCLSSSQKIYGEDLDEKGNMKALSLVDFYVRPHLNSEFFPNLREEIIRDNLKDFNGKNYAIDDNCAIKVIDGKEEVVGNGKWFVINK